MGYWCSKYDGRITQDKAFHFCLKKGCPHLHKSRKKNGKIVKGRLPKKLARDEHGHNKGVIRKKNSKKYP